MAAEPPFVPPGVAITAIDGEGAEVTLSGDVSAVMLRELETLLADLRLQRAQYWVLDMQGVRRIELACAYALLRAVTEHSGTAVVRGARRPVRRTLRHAGLDRAAAIEE
ncbi:STAS domain-containing protein [Streptomyces massasporeus]|uniref:STAS domain-containing protein n=1 Tax=Streptomyces TaxID=1883 RepID=UPI0027E0CFC8|nr:STAS domain-containing protein [Streptomyces sp. WAC04114]